MIDLFTLVMAVAVGSTISVGLVVLVVALFFINIAKNITRNNINEFAEFQKEEVAKMLALEKRLIAHAIATETQKTSFMVGGGKKEDYN